MAAARCCYGRGIAGDTAGNSPASKWVAFSAIAEHLGYGRRYTTRSNQVHRSFEDTAFKQRALDLVMTAEHSGGASNLRQDWASGPARMPTSVMRRTSSQRNRRAWLGGL